MALFLVPDIGNAIDYTMSALQTPEVKSAACLSLKNLCDGCGVHLTENTGDLVQVFLQSMAAGLLGCAIRFLVSTPLLDFTLEERMQLVEAVAHVISYVDVQQVSHFMGMVRPRAARLWASAPYANTSYRCTNP